MSKRIKITLLITIVALLLGGAASYRDNSHAVIERNGIRLVVPQRYILEDRFWWLNFVPGLDSDEGSINIKIPPEELRAILPQALTKHDPTLHLFATIFVQGPGEAAKAAAAGADVADEISRKRDRFTQAIAVPDKDTGWYRVYQMPDIDFLWYVLRRSPYDPQNRTPITTDDIVALCVRSPNIPVSCAIYSFMVKGIYIDTSIDGQYLPYYKLIQRSSAVATMSNQVLFSTNFGSQAR